MRNRLQQGHAAEKAAVALLRSKGYKIVATNYRCAEGELDIIAKDGAELVFVEVRSRSSSRFGDAFDAVGPAKQRQVIRVAQAYLSREQPCFETSRFDVVGVTNGVADHIVDAFC